MVIEVEVYWWQQNSQRDKDKDKGEDEDKENKKSAIKNNVISCNIDANKKA